MIGLELQIAAALALDLALGDPRWAWHPVRLMGRFTAWTEGVTRRMPVSLRAAGCATAVITVGVSVAVTLGLVNGATAAAPWLGDAVSVIILYTTLSARDLARHAMEVYRALARGDLGGARCSVGMLVGRDTHGLDEAGVARAATESVAENTVDGVTAPLFYAALAGPAGAIVYKAINTMDSMFGHRNEKYEKFGWAPARLDDAANYLPARITAVIIFLCAGLTGMNASRSVSTAIRDGRKHRSPNSGFPEAAFAGALGVRLGGVSHYGGRETRLPHIGEAIEPLEKGHVRGAVRLMYAVSLVSAALFLGVRLAVIGL